MLGTSGSNELEATIAAINSFGVFIVIIDSEREPEWVCLRSFASGSGSSRRLMTGTLRYE